MYHTARMEAPWSSKSFFRNASAVICFKGKRGRGIGRNGTTVKNGRNALKDR